MSLVIAKLQKVRRLADGTIQARCPACAEGGQDRRGEHLRVFADGRFGCCVHAKDREHRKRIFALAGAAQGRLGVTGSFKVKVATRVEAAPAARSVRASLADWAGTLGTGAPESLLKQPAVLQGGECRRPLPALEPARANPELGTLGTPFLNPCAYRENSPTCKDTEKGVPSVVREAKGEKLPYLTADGTLVIPFDSPERYHWWQPGGQSVEQTLFELRTVPVAVVGTSSTSSPAPTPAPTPTAVRTPTSEPLTPPQPESFYGDDL